jgi:dTDP-4-amino-4,6-dideoxygalactose transaminase
VKQEVIGRRESFLVFGAPLIEEAEIDEVVRTLRSGWIGTGPKVGRFEQAFRDFVGAPHAAAVNSCTAALHLSLLASDVGPGDEVITTAMTFCATVNAIIHTGATPVLADVDPATFNIDPEQIRRKMSSRTRAIVPVHFAGRPCDMDALSAIAAERGLRVIEDCAHAIETQYHGRQAGTFGDFGCFSFYVTKNIITGEGGMVVCKREDDIARIKVLALHGMSKDAWKHYQVIDCGFKYNMMDLQASLGIHQLARVERYHARRSEIWRQYDAAFSGLPIAIPAPPEPRTRHAMHLYTLLIDRDRCGISRDRFLQEMTQRNIGVGVHYLCIADHPFYQRAFGWRPEQVPNATRIGRQTVSLPLGPKLSDGDVADVIGAVRACLDSN